MFNVDECVCGHPASDHVRLPGFPGGAEECQAEHCDCGSYRDAIDYDDEPDFSHESEPTDDDAPYSDDEEEV